ncbi:hypothetical protein O1451_20815 [Bacteroides fragilis]|uniref:hypothetical protein n=1 Tax=Bacteroides fragilis TaxID=817 RepID=UPI0022AA5B2F|nr:hypothetical protein [Bacteroides fragilis]MCZ2608980.1 hypothetical protein [Bacteroides fragilis]
MKHLAEKIKELMAAFSRSHHEYMMFEEYGMPDFSKLSEEERLDYEMDEQERKKGFPNLHGKKIASFSTSVY